MSGAQPDARVLRGATRRLAALTAAAVTVVLLVVGAVVVAVVRQEQEREARVALRLAVVDLDDLARAPVTVGVWLRTPEGSQRRSPRAPAWLPVRAAAAAVTSAAPRDERVVRRGGQSFQLLTVRRHGLVAQAVTSTDPQSQERDRLLTGLVVAEVVGLGLSLLLGGLLARRAMAPLVTAMQRQRRFVADASHELRTPLTLLSTRAQLLERSLRRSAPENVHAESQELVADTRRLAEVVDDLLLSASLTDQPGRSEPVDLVALARAARRAAAAHAAEQGVAVEGPPGGSAPVTVLGAPGPLRRVLDALLDNAVTHTLPGGRVVVRVDAGPPATVQVIDNGPGIDPAVAPRLFDRFAHGRPAGSGDTTASVSRWFAMWSRPTAARSTSRPLPAAAPPSLSRSPRRHDERAPARSARRRRVGVPRREREARDTPWLHAAAVDVATYGVVLFGVVLLAGWWVSRGQDARTVAAALWAGGATLLAVAVNPPLVRASHEPRPYISRSGLLVLAHRSADLSLPSDHAVMAGAAAAGLWLVSRRLGLLATVAALLMAASRVYVAAHYPHDVVAGLAVGAGVTMLGWLVVRRPLTALVDRLAVTPLRLLLVSG